MLNKFKSSTLLPVDHIVSIDRDTIPFGIMIKLLDMLNYNSKFSINNIKEYVKK